jgi:hypothetical protein
MYIAIVLGCCLLMGLHLGCPQVIFLFTAFYLLEQGGFGVPPRFNHIISVMIPSATLGGAASYLIT